MAAAAGEEVSGVVEVARAVAVGSVVYAAGRWLLRTASRRGALVGVCPHEGASRVVCLCHAVASPMLGALCAASVHAAPDAPYTPLPLLTRVVWWEIGYYLLDMVLEVTDAVAHKGLSVLSLGFQLHHLVPLAGAYTYTYWRAAGASRLRATDWVTGCLLLQNFSTVFQHGLWWLRKLDVPHAAPLHRATLAAFFSSFVVLRLFGLVWLMRTYSAMRLAADGEGAGGGVVPASVAHGWSLMPWRCRVSVAVLAALNAVWLCVNVKNKLLRGGRRLASTKCE